MQRGIGLGVPPGSKTAGVRVRAARLGDRDSSVTATEGRFHDEARCCGTAAPHDQDVVARFGLGRGDQVGVLDSLGL